MGKFNLLLSVCLLIGISSCSDEDDTLLPRIPTEETANDEDNSEDAADNDTPHIPNADCVAYSDANGDIAFIPADFKISGNPTERTIKTGLVVIGPDGSEYVWIPTSTTELAVRDFGSYFSGGSLSGYADETSLALYREMTESVEEYGGFYIGRYEASYGEEGIRSKTIIPRVNRCPPPDIPGRIWVRFSPQDATIACRNLYRDNSTVKGFFPWGINWDTALQWLIDSGCLTMKDVAEDSTSWGNYSNDSFSPNANGNYTGRYEEAKTNNIYDLAGNNWEWT